MDLAKTKYGKNKKIPLKIICDNKVKNICYIK